MHGPRRLLLVVETGEVDVDAATRVGLGGVPHAPRPADGVVVERRVGRGGVDAEVEAVTAMGEGALVGTDARDASIGVDVHRVHGREVDHCPVVADRAAGDLVATAADGDGGPVLARQADRRLHVGSIGAARDHRGVPVDEAVPDAPRGVVLRVRAVDHLAAQLQTQGVDQLLRDSGAGHVDLLSKPWGSW
jgi:hypothetical protein